GSRRHGEHRRAARPRLHQVDLPLRSDRHPPGVHRAHARVRPPRLRRDAHSRPGVQQMARRALARQGVRCHVGDRRAAVIARAYVTLALVACSALAAPVEAQVGGKVMRIVVPFAAGGAREVLARSFYSELGAGLGQTLIVENRPGAGGAIGTASVAKAAPDGNTLLFAASSHNVTALFATHPAYDPLKDFAAVANIGMQSYVLMASAQFPVRTVSQLVSHAKAHPG